MAIVLDVLNAGESAIDSAGTTIAVNTTATIAAGATIIVTGTSVDPIVASSVANSGTALTWSVDMTGVEAGADQGAIYLASAYATSGMASGTTITVTYTGSSIFARSIAVTSFTGIPSASRVDVTSGPTSYTSGTAWTSASTSIAAGSLLIAVAGDFVDQKTSTVTGPSLEAHDFGGGVGTFAQTTCYRIEASAASYTVAGTWSGTARGVVGAVAYKAAAGTGSLLLPNRNLAVTRR